MTSPVLVPNNDDNNNNNQDHHPSTTPSSSPTIQQPNHPSPHNLYTVPQPQPRSPVCILHKTLGKQNTLLKRDPRPHRAQYLPISPIRARSSPLSGHGHEAPPLSERMNAQTTTSALRFDASDCH